MSAVMTKVHCSPWLVRSTCHGRYPLDEMAVRIALEMRRSFQLWFKKERRIFERGLAKETRFITAMRVNIIPRTDPTLRKCIVIYIL